VTTRSDLGSTILGLISGSSYYHLDLTSNEAEYRRLQARVPGKVLLTQLGSNDRRFNTRPGQDQVARKESSTDITFIPIDETSRRHIACGGRIRCIDDSYSWQAIMARDWQSIKDTLQTSFTCSRGAAC